MPPTYRIFVGNIPYSYNEDDLKKILSLVGPIKNFSVIKDPNTKKSKGYGFCDYTNKDVAKSATRNLNNIEYNGRQLKINTQDKDKNLFNFDDSNQILSTKGIEIEEEIEDSDCVINPRNDINEASISKKLFGKLNQEQKIFLLFLIKNLLDKEPNLLLQQNDEVLQLILGMQEEMMRNIEIK